MSNKQKSHRDLLCEYLTEHEIEFKKNARLKTLEKLINEHKKEEEFLAECDAQRDMVAEETLAELDAEVAEAVEEEGPEINPDGKKVFLGYCSKTREEKWAYVK